MDSSILQEITAPDPSTLIILFEIILKDENEDLIGSNYRFHSGENGFENSIIFKGEEYLYVPCEANGFDATDESLPRPTIRFDNTDSFFGLKSKLFKDFIGFEVIRRKTFVKFLHGDNFPGTLNPYGSGTEASYPDEEFLVNSKIMENQNYIEFELVSKLEKEGGTIPGRKIVYNVCQWKYRSKHGCGYIGTKLLDEKDNELESGSSASFYNANTTYSVGNVVKVETQNNDETIIHYYVCIQAGKGKNPLTQPTYWTKDDCSKSLFGCRARFGSKERSDGLPFGGFPGSWKS